MATAINQYGIKTPTDKKKKESLLSKPKKKPYKGYLMIDQEGILRKRFTQEQTFQKHVKMQERIQQRLDPLVMLSKLHELLRKISFYGKVNLTIQKLKMN